MAEFSYPEYLAAPFGEATIALLSCYIAKRIAVVDCQKQTQERNLHIIFM